jgi:hypothetical protein
MDLYYLYAERVHVLYSTPNVIMIPRGTGDGLAVRMTTTQKAWEDEVI